MNIPVMDKCINIEASKTGWKLFVDGVVPEVIIAVGLVAMGLLFVWLKWGRKNA